MKYLRHRTKGFFIFPESVTHRDMANAVCAKVEVDVQSAGFIEVREGRPVCYGHSVSLEASSGAGDTQELRRNIGAMV